jgi:hypothetical protein
MLIDRSHQGRLVTLTYLVLHTSHTCCTHIQTGDLTVVGNVTITTGGVSSASIIPALQGISSAGTVTITTGSLADW